MAEYTSVTEWDAHYAGGRGFRRVIDAEVALLAEHLGPGDGRRALDVGCGTGGYAHTVHGLGYQVLGVDYAPSAISTSRDRYEPLDGLQFQQWDAEGDAPALLPWPRFALVTCRLSYAFIQDKPRFLQLVRSLLEPGGALHITTPLVERLPEERRGIGITSAEADQLREGWSSTLEYDLDQLRCFVLRPIH